MCGFVGFTGKRDDAETIIDAMMSKIIHRGPDDLGVHITEEISLGFRRLSILDIEDGKQPMLNDDGSIVIVFNGEITNYKLLRDELIEAGYTFKTKTDTEVLLHAYEEYNTKLLDKLRGMFAFVIYDYNLDLLFGARDFFGVKPFYYSVLDGQLLFASEIKPILAFDGFKRQLNPDALEGYLSFQYSVLDETFFSGIFKLPPGHYMLYQNGKLEKSRYFFPLFLPEERSLVDDIDDVEHAILEAIEQHKASSDVEVGSFLSGGVDSGMVTACADVNKTFTVGFDYANYNEIQYATELSELLNVKNYSKTITTQEYWDILPTVQYYMEEPLADPAAVAFYFASRLAAEHVKVALSGEGADEFFGGYNIYQEPLSLEKIGRLPLTVRRWLARVAEKIPFKFKGKNFLIRAAKPLEERFIGNAYIFTQQECEQILKSPTGNYSVSDVTGPYYRLSEQHDDITKMQYIDINLWLVGDILLNADKMSMAHSLEVRVPLLDKRVWLSASTLKTKHRVNKKFTKHVFRLAAQRHLPGNVATRKKLGFPVPIRIWLKDKEYSKRVYDAFNSAAAHKYFHVEKINDLMREHETDKADNSRKIWTIYMFLVWYEQFFNDEQYAKKLKLSEGV